ncbi:Uncharacterized 50 kDa protein in type I retrotransposable element R1DM, partial [Harpegnathos saltator]
TVGLKVDKMIPGRNGSVRIVAASEEIDKIKNSAALNGTGLVAGQFDKMNPRLIVRGVPANMDRTTFVQCLVKQNLDDTNEDDVKVIYWFPIIDRKSTSVIIEVSPDLRKRLLSRDRVYLDWSSCNITDYVRITQCFRCLSVGHIAKDCRAREDVCGHCGDSHESRSCKDRAKPKCHNCTLARCSSVDHSAFDSRRCPMLQRHVKER